MKLFTAVFLLALGMAQGGSIMRDSQASFRIRGEDGRCAASLMNQGGTARDMRESMGDVIHMSVACGETEVRLLLSKFNQDMGEYSIVSDDAVFSSDDLTSLAGIAEAILGSPGIVNSKSENANPRARILGSAIEWLVQAGAGDRKIASREIPIRIHRDGPKNAATDEEEEEAGQSARRRLLSHTCSDPYLGNLNSPHPYEPNCPYWGGYEEDDGVWCLCPYGGGGWWDAWYDTREGNLVWRRQKGSDTPDCTGRCGAGCNWLDKEATYDCFEHDSCLDHVGGDIFFSNPDCGDEVDHAADDYIATYGWFCC